MKKMNLFAAAALTIGLGSAFAQSTDKVYMYLIDAKLDYKENPEVGDPTTIKELERTVQKCEWVNGETLEPCVDGSGDIEGVTYGFFYTLDGLGYSVYDKDVFEEGIYALRVSVDFADCKSVPKEVAYKCLETKRLRVEVGGKSLGEGGGVNSHGSDLYSYKPFGIGIGTKFSVGEGHEVSVMPTCYDKAGIAMSSCNISSEGDIDIIVNSVAYKGQNVSANFKSDKFALKGWPSNMDVRQGGKIIPTSDIASRGWLSNYFQETHFTVGGEGNIVFYPEFYERDLDIEYVVSSEERTGEIYDAQTKALSTGDNVVFKARGLDGFELKSLSGEYADKATGKTATIDASLFMADYEYYEKEPVFSSNIFKEQYRYVLSFKDGDISPRDGKVKIFAEFEKSADAIDVALNSSLHGSYYATYKTWYYKVTENMTFSTVPKSWSKLVIVMTPEKGYTADGVRISYFTNNSELNGITLSVPDSVKNGIFFYSTDLPEKSELAELMPTVYVQPDFAKIINVKMDISGKVDAINILDEGKENVICSNASEKCELIQGVKYVIQVKPYEGHDFTSLSCDAENAEAYACESVVEQTITAKEDFTLKATFEARKYTVQASSSFPVEFFDTEMNRIEVANALDTVLMAAKDEGKAIYTVSVNGTMLHPASSRYPGNGEYFFFVMPAENVVANGEVGDAYHVTVTGVDGLATYGTSVLAANDLYVDKNTFIAGEKFYLHVKPVEGYFIDEESFGDQCKSVYANPEDAEEIVCVAEFAETETEDITISLRVKPMEWKVLDVAATKVVVEGIEKNQTIKTDEEVSFTVTPVAKYEIDFVKVTYEEIEPAEGDGEPAVSLVVVATTETEKDGVYTYKFKMPAKDIKVEAVAKLIESSSSSVIPGTDPESQSGSSSSSKTDAIFAAAHTPKFSLSVAGRSVQIAGASVGSAYAILDMQGRIMTTGSVESANFSVVLPRSGSYMVRVGSQTMRMSIK